MFQTIPENGDSIPTETLTAHRNLTNHNREHLNLNAEEGELGQERETESSHNNERDSHGWSVMNNLEQALNSGDFSAAAKKRHTASTAYSHEEKPQLRQHIEENDEGASARTAEEKLAALGVTGLPKPVRAPARPWPPPELGSESHPGVGDQGSRSRSRSPDFHDR